MIIFVYGKDIYRSHEKLKEVIASFQEKRDKSGLNVIRLDCADFNFDKFRQELMTQGFMTPRKMIVLTNLLSECSKDIQVEVFEYLKKSYLKQDDSNILVFWQGEIDSRKLKGSKLFDFLKKQEYVYEFPELSGVHLENWVIKRVEACGGRIRKEGACRICQLVGTDMWQLVSEIDKLVNFRNGEEICIEDINQFIDSKFEANIFALTDAIASKNKKRALSLLENELNNGANEFYLLSMISRQYRILLQIKDLLDKGQDSSAKIAKDLNLHPFVIQKSIAPAKHYTMDSLIEIHERLVKTDCMLKMTKLNSHLLLDLLIVN